MAGYSGFSKSNNAIDAEENDERNATQLAKLLHCSSHAVKNLLTPSSWHHTSKQFNKTNYYYEPLLTALAQKKELDDFDRADFNEEEIEEARALLAKLQSYTKNDVPVTYENCHVDWIEWRGR